MDHENFANKNIFMIGHISQETRLGELINICFILLPILLNGDL